MAYRRSRGSDWGSFAKGFSDAFAAMLKLNEDRRHNEALEAHWARVEGLDPRYGANAAGAAAAAGYKEGVGGAGGGGDYRGPTQGEDAEMRDHIIKWSQEHGKNPAEALAIWRQESGGGQAMKGDGGSSFSDFQFHFGGMNAAMPHPGMGDDFKRATGIDLRTDHSQESRYKAVDFALERASSKGWGDWVNSVKATGVPMKWGDAKKTETVKAEPTVDGKPAVTEVNVSGKPPEAKAPEGKPTAQADIPAADVQNVEFQTPGGGPAFPLPGDQPLTPPSRGPSGDPAEAGAGDSPVPIPGTPHLPPAPVPPQGPQLQGPIAPNWGEASQPALPPVPGEGPIDPSIIARQRIPPRQYPARPTSTGPMPHPYETPSSVPDQYGPPQRTGAPPNVGITPSSIKVAEAAGGGRKGPAEVNVPLAGGGRDARSELAGANKPAPNAQPVSAIPPTPRVQSQDNSRFVLVDAPNASPNQRNRPQITALNLSSLWGPNPPLAQRGQAAAVPSSSAAASSPPPRREDENIPNPDLTGVTDEMIMGQAKGGPIRRYAQGGAIPMRPVMRYDAGGPAASDAMGAGTGAGYNSGGGSRGGQYYINASRQFTPADYTARTSISNQMQQALPVSMNDPNFFGTVSNAVAGMTPEQQQWYMNAGRARETMANYPGLGGVIASQVPAYPTTPAATAATTTPATQTTTAAPIVNPITEATVKDTTVVDPTTEAGTGAPGIPKAPKAKSYDPNVDTRTGAGFVNTQNAGGTNYSVGSDDLLKTNLSKTDENGVIAGYARGGAIPLRPTMKFATGGGAAMAALLSPSYSGPTAGGGWAGTPYEQMAPNQQTWSNTQKGLLAQVKANANNPAWAGWSQLSGTPAAIWPTAAAASTAPAVVNQPPPTLEATTPAAPAVDPNNQPGKGVPGVPDVVAPVAPVNPAVDPLPPPPPIVDPTTGVGVNTPTNPVPKQAKTYDPTQDTTGKYASRGHDVGEANYRTPRTIDPTSATDFGAFDYGQIQGFEDGGGVAPSAFGMPPGLAGGQQPVPPIYYNASTYTPAGAPIGRGVTQNSIPTQIGAAIPALPMAMGGMVRRYATGGEVGGEVDEYTGMPNEDITQGGRSGSAQYTGDDSGSPPNVDYASVSSPQEAHPNLPAWTPQVNDGQGNPSRGLIGAIAGGLHYLASQLGLGGQEGAVAGDANTQANRMSFARGDGVPGAPMPSHAEVTAIHQSLGLNDGLHQGLANLAGMEAARNFYITHGDVAKGDQMAASMLQYSVSLARDYGDQAVQRYYANDLNGAVHALVRAKEMIADGTLMNAEVNPDGRSVNIEGTNLSGQRLWAKTVGPEAILGAALHTADGSMAWHLYEAQAAKYDPVSQQKAAERRQDQRWEHQNDVTQQNWAHQQEVLEQKDAAKAAAAEKAAQAENAVLQGTGQPSGPQITPATAPPAIPVQATQPTPVPNAPAAPVQATAASPETAATQPTPGSVPDSTAVAATLTPPPATDTANAQAGAIPSTAAQPVSADMGPSVRPNPAQDPRYASLPAAAQARVSAIYNQEVAARKAWESAQYTQRRDDERAAATIEAAKTAETGRQKFETTKEQSARAHEYDKPRDPHVVAAAFSSTPNETGIVTGKEPTTYMAEALGYVKEDGTPDLDKLNKNVPPDLQPTIANAMINAYTLSGRATPMMIVQGIMGTLTNPKYIMHKTPIADDVTYGVPRYSVSVDHGDGTSSHFILPVEDYDNLVAAYDRMPKPPPPGEKPPAQVNSESVAPLPAVGQAIQGALPGLFPNFKPGESPADWLRNPTGANPATAPTEAAPTINWDWYHRQGEPLRKPPPPLPPQ